MNPLHQQIQAWQAPQFNPAGLLRFAVLGHDLGWLRAPVASFLLQFDPAFIQTPDRLRLNISDITSAETLLQQATFALRQHGLVPGWRDELYDLHATDAQGWPDLQRPLLKLERAAFRTFGFTSLAVHINGYTNDGQLWIARRAPSKAVDPNMLDNLAAGGVASGEAMADCAVRELWEEAGVPAALAQQAQASGVLHTRRNVAEGVHDELLYVFDLQVPASFTPQNTDGEVAGFILLDTPGVVGRLSELTWDAAAVTLDFLQRHQWLERQA